LVLANWESWVIMRTLWIDANGVNEVKDDHKCLTHGQSMK
jgi:hypothetical protein